MNKQKIENLLDFIVLQIEDRGLEVSKVLRIEIRNGIIRYTEDIEQTCGMTKTFYTEKRKNRNINY
jgi:hypothetical protein